MVFLILEYLDVEEYLALRLYVHGGLNENLDLHFTIQVVEGYDEVVRTIEATPTGPADRPLEDVIVKECGPLPLVDGPYEIDFEDAQEI